ncbi:AraC family transcriptional regulator [Clostridium transplantifaecale]|uniref:AraC family transcriptional regulator n=1 Tax=Clostridium transplantifaecale TaxID=2479838 RepID=UPI000F63AE79|nr:AraC family transcriptional regulator [Clostridium transplantifaecale]
MSPSMFQDQSVVLANRILYTASSFARANLIHLQEIGESEALKPHTSRRKGLLSYLFFIVLEGAGTVGCDGTEYHLKQGDCVFLDCRKPYFQRAEAERLWRLKWVHFYGPNMNGIYDKYLQRGGLPCFTSRHMSEYEHLLDELYGIAASDLYIRDMKIFEKLTAILSLLMEESWNQSSAKPKAGTGRREMQPIKDYIDQHYRERLTLEGLSEQFFINKFYLTRVFKEQYGISINNYIQQLRITRAKLLLRFSELSIENVGRECGIDDANYFSRVFKKVEEVSPWEFRRMWAR